MDVKTFKDKKFSDYNLSNERSKLVNVVIIYYEEKDIIIKGFINHLTNESKAIKYDDAVKDELYNGYEFIYDCKKLFLNGDILSELIEFTLEYLDKDKNDLSKFFRDLFFQSREIRIM